MSSLGTMLLATTIHVAGVPVHLTVTEWIVSARLGTLYHFEFRSPHTPPRPIPVSETGYRSHFAYDLQVEAYADLEEAGRALAAALAGSRAPDRAHPDQIALFD